MEDPDVEPAATPTPSSDDSTTHTPKKSNFFSKFKKSSNKSSKDDSDGEDKLPPVQFHELFRYTTRSEKIFMAIACICASIHGSLLPIFTILFGQIIDEFGQTDSIDLDQITTNIGSVAKWFIVLAVVAFFASFIQVSLQLVVSQRVCARLRRKFFESVMSQDYTWIDENKGGELTARVAGDVNLVQAGIGDKVTAAVQFMSMFVIGIIVAFIYGPLLTLVILAVAPLLMGSGVIFGKFAAESTGEGLGAYGSAGAIATEVIGLIRTVTAYNGQESEARRFEVELQKAYKAGVRRSLFAGIGFGAVFLVIFGAYGIAFAFGASRVRSGQMEAGEVLTTFFSVFIACISLGQGTLLLILLSNVLDVQNCLLIVVLLITFLYLRCCRFTWIPSAHALIAAPSFQAFTVARGAAPRIYEVIERESEINPLDEDFGKIIPNFEGHIEFKNVDFNYKTRIIDDLQDESARPFVLNNFSIDVPRGTSHALVGSSGCGKSTTVRLIERFYDVQNGRLELDGINIQDLNVRWLRSQIGYVGQMPTLFKLSIKDNIALGAQMDEIDVENKKTIFKRRKVTDEEIIEAAKKANAHDFIMKLPEKYDTMLGERGALLSGGQKQRVCIARALVRNPKILILDEATAALDAQSERTVQEALERAAAGRTTIIIAHRLSTVRNADVISVIDKGRIVETGTHSKLININNGAYRTLVEHQNVEAQNVENITGKPADMDEAGAAQVFTDSISRTVPEKADDTTKETEQTNTESGVLLRTFRLNMPEVPFMLFGILGGAMAGAAFPVMAIVFSEAIFEMTQNNRSEVIRKWALSFLAIGGGAFVGNFLQLGVLGISGERLSRRLRGRCFRTILKQNMGFFDERNNSLGALATRLATEAPLVKGITGDTLGALAFAVSSILTGIIVAYTGCWRVALVVTAIFPFIAISGALQLKMMTGFDADSEQRFAEAGAIASEAVDNFDTVTSVGVQDVFIAKYNKELETPIKNGKKTALVAGVAFGMSEFLAQALWAISFWVGSIFVRSGDCNFLELMKAITGLLFAGMMLGNVSATMPDIAKAKIAATNVFRLLDRESTIDPTDETGETPVISGHVEAKSVTFEYPTRPNVSVLRGVSLTVSPGQTLALVGASGCGKSTIVALLERFYDSCSGEIVIDNTEIRDFRVSSFRQQLGLVSQEPDLFNRSIRDNISYGLDQSDGTPVTDEIIFNAAKAANAHSFISELNDGYDTVVGPRGSRLSGGQRQRVAIARAIVRQPRILLLDEATSALDAVSERVVQDALDTAASGRTTVAVAHRLSTVKDADVIAVVSRGKIMEVGTHDQLLRIPDGEYANLVKNQMTTADNGDS